MTYFLFDLASCTTVHAALGSARTVCGSQLMRGSQPFRRLYTSHFCCPFLVCCALSDKMCGCVCVCVCAPTVYKLGSQIDFSVFSASLFGIFDVSQRTCSQNQCLFPFHLLDPLALLSNVYAATAILSMFSLSRLDLCTAILSNTASLRVPRFGAEHCRE